MGHFHEKKALRLLNIEPFGIGGRRLCFVHPNDPKKCVKVLRQDSLRTVRLKGKLRFIPDYLQRPYDNNRHEMRELLFLQRRLGDEMGYHLPRCYGMTPTDIGPGLVLDLVRDYDGTISRSIRELISLGYDLARLRPAFDEFGEFLARHLVLTRKLCDHNLVVSMDELGPRAMYLIDGFGDPAWLPLARWIAPLGRAKARRRVVDAWRNFERFAATGGVTEEMRRNSTWGQGILNHRG